MQVRTITPKRLLTPQKNSFLTEGQYPFTHTRSWAIGYHLPRPYLNTSQ